MSRTDSSDSACAAPAIAAEPRGLHCRSLGGRVIPTEIVVDRTTPVVARRFPLAAALLSAYAHEGTLIGDYSAKDAARMDDERAGALFAIPRACPSTRPSAGIPAPAPPLLLADRGSR
jgi:hypothetical protein